MGNTACKLKRKPDEAVSVYLMEEFLPYYKYATVKQIALLCNQPEFIVRKAADRLERSGGVKFMKKNNMEIICLNARQIKVDYTRIRALWVLIRALEGSVIEFHQPGNSKFGILIHFIVGKHYEIHYCAEGNTAIFNAKMRILDESYANEEDIPEKIILLDQIADKKKLQGKHIYAFATATMDGEVHIFNGRK